VWRYLREGIDLHAAAADTLEQVMTRVVALAYAILDGTLIPIDRVAEDRPYTLVNTGGMASTCRSWPMRRAGWCGPRRCCPAPPTT
jgi:hypothetical protein